ncbi:multicopper oxidase family protein [Microbispora triticiradicis]|uniref:Multicopper oxidase domain-containing protein n=2 Tax=Microbispora TaxID=2005 RepID=A0ABY3M5D3_9ACTN|nr:MULTISPECIES: multicopper oxidase [Microbispora]TLP66613.1 twin-arginine translocation signal domain-containing protein [Microbispora fusca]TYB67571.1 multicopper oxidase domain-containing protein [Microbispora tritici]
MNTRRGIRRVTRRLTRRDFLKGCAAVTLVGARGPAGPTRRPAPAGPPLLDAASVPKYVAALPVPAVMPAAPTGDGSLDRYVIGVRRFRQQILPPGAPPTTVFGYGSAPHRGTFAVPGRTIEARVDRPVQVTWVNELVDRWGDHVPHLLPVDPTLHWANPPGGPPGRDGRPAFAATPGPYRGPVPVVTHLHGGHSPDDSDGYPEAWFLAAGDTPAGYAREGSRYAGFAAAFEGRTGVAWYTGSAVNRYGNDQHPGTLWYHDHTLGVTRLNVYAGMAGFYLLRGGPADLPSGVLPGPAPGAGAGDPAGTRCHEIPIVIQDRTFTADGSLHYPGSRAAGGYGGPYVPRTDVPPIWVPEFFGAAMTANGRTWPLLEVERRRYRFRFLNGCNARVLALGIAGSPVARPVRSALPFWQIGADGAFLPAPVALDRLLLAPAERADVVVDFTCVPPGTPLYLVNEGPDGPYRGETAAPPADPATTGQVLKFLVRPASGRDLSVPPDQLELPQAARLGPAVRTRRLALLEQSSAVRGAGPVTTLLGEAAGRGWAARKWHDPVTENPGVGDVEMWEFHNLTPDAHPIHIHEILFEVVDRTPFHGPARPARPWERGRKDTVIALPREVTRVKAHFDRAGLFVWHCHMLEHEDNEMMRPYRIGGRPREPAREAGRNPGD